MVAKPAAVAPPHVAVTFTAPDAAVAKLAAVNVAVLVEEPSEPSDETPSVHA